MARHRTTSAALRCSFCGKQADEVEQLIAGGARAGTFICDQCLEVADDIRAEHLAEPPAGLASIGIRELRSQVAALVRRAAAGERLIVTVDGRPMAQLGPIEPVGAPQLEDLAAAGLVEPPRAPTPGAAPEPEDLPVDVRLDRVIDDLRGR